MTVVSNPIISIDIRGLKFNLGSFYLIALLTLCDRKLSFIICEMGGGLSSRANK